MSYAQQVHVETNGAGDAEGQLPEERISGVDVIALAILGQQQSTFLRLLAGIVRGQERRVVLVPLVHEVQAALLHPAIEVAVGDRVGIMKHRVLRIENRYRRLLNGYALAAQLHRIRGVVAVVEVAGRGVVLHDQRAAVAGVVQKPLIILLHIVARIVGANAQHDGPEAIEIAAREIAGSKQRDVEAEFAQHVGNIVAGSHDVADLQTLRNFDLDDAGALERRLIVEEAANIRPRDQAVALAVIAAAGTEQRANLVARFFCSVRRLFEVSRVLARLCERNIF